MLINVRCRKGRVAFSAPVNGNLIPDDRFVPVEKTAYIDRLINFHKDLEVEKKTEVIISVEKKTVAINSDK